MNEQAVKIAALIDECERDCTASGCRSDAACAAFIDGLTVALGIVQATAGTPAVH